jgi:hypothetical protein
LLLRCSVIWDAHFEVKRRSREIFIQVMMFEMDIMIISNTPSIFIKELIIPRKGE